MTEFAALNLHTWRQFDLVEIDLSKQFTVLTGQNGCGKTTLLNLLNRHFGWSINFVSTPYLSKKRKKRLWSDVYRRDDVKSVDDADSAEKGATKPEERTEEDTESDDALEGIDTLDEGVLEIGEIKYRDGTICRITVNALIPQQQYNPEYHGMQPVEGLHIPSHRPVASYTSVPNIPTDPKTATQEYQQYQQLLIQFYGGNRADNPGKIQKQSLISFAVFGEGNSSVTANAEIREHYEKFQDVLRAVLPKTLGFRKLEIRMPEVVLVTDTGDFSLDAMSGGINAIFSIAWQIHMFAQDKEEFTVTIDEPENHLHPSMQRTFLPSLAAAFPSAKFIISTHSPFVVSSFPDANVYALVRSGGRGIVSHRLDLLDISGTPNEVLREILDVGSNLPVWVEDKIAHVIANAADLPPDQKARLIMSELEKLGIADSIAEYTKGEPDAPNR